MSNPIPAGSDVLDTWLIDSGGHVAVSNADLALLGSELPSRFKEPSGTPEILRPLTEG